MNTQRVVYPITLPILYVGYFIYFLYITDSLYNLYCLRYSYSCSIYCYVYIIFPLTVRGDRHDKTSYGNVNLPLLRIVINIILLKHVRNYVIKRQCCKLIISMQSICLLSSLIKKKFFLTHFKRITIKKQQSIHIFPSSFIRIKTKLLKNKQISKKQCLS